MGQQHLKPHGMGGCHGMHCVEAEQRRPHSKHPMGVRAQWRLSQCKPLTGPPHRPQQGASLVHTCSITTVTLTHTHNPPRPQQRLPRPRPARAPGDVGLRGRALLPLLAPRARLLNCYLRGGRGGGGVPAAHAHNRAAAGAGAAEDDGRGAAGAGEHAHREVSVRWCIGANGA